MPPTGFPPVKWQQQSMPTLARLVANRETTFGALNMRRVSSETRVLRMDFATAEFGQND